MPLFYELEALARRFGVPPWALASDDPEVSRWVHRGLVFQSLEAQAVKRN